MKLITFLGTTLFTMSAVLQYNDPDALVWSLAYLAAAVICVLAFIDRIPPILALVTGFFYFVFGIYLAIEVIGQHHWFDELGREMFGLLIVGLWLHLIGISLFMQRRIET